METIHVTVLKALAERAKLLAGEAIDEIIDAIDNKILVGDIHRPAEKKPRKKRVRKPFFLKTLETKPPTQGKDLPDADENSTFYGKKKPRKEAE